MVSNLKMLVRALIIVSVTASAALPSAQAQQATTDDVVQVGTDTSTNFQVIHESVLLPVNYDTFTRNLKFLLGRFDPEDFALAAVHPKQGYQRLKAAAGEQGLMLFQGANDHGALFATLGQKRKALRLSVGNPQIALQMTRHNISAALFAPLTILVHEVDANSTRVEYIRPSTLFGQLKVPEIDKVAIVLDGKLRTLLTKAATLKPE